MSDDDTPEPTAGTPVLISVGLILASLIVAAGHGFLRGSIFAALLGGAACIPAGYTIWLGMQSKGQEKALYGILLILAGAALFIAQIVLRVLHVFV